VSGKLLFQVREISEFRAGLVVMIKMAAGWTIPLGEGGIFGKKMLLLFFCGNQRSHLVEHIGLAVCKISNSRLPVSFR
jgi:hypothetical protein